MCPVYFKRWYFAYALENCYSLRAEDSSGLKWKNGIPFDFFAHFFGIELIHWFYWYFLTWWEISRTRICKRLRNPGMDYKESIPPSLNVYKYGLRGWGFICYQYSFIKYYCFLQILCSGMNLYLLLVYNVNVTVINFNKLMISNKLFY